MPLDAPQPIAGDPIPPNRGTVRSIRTLPGPFRDAVAYLSAHPMLVLLMLSPGIPEYLSGSSPLTALVLNPVGFLVQLALNLGLYGPGVLLIREAQVRWNKGFATVLVLGAAYGILEEGVALSTMFNPHASVVGDLGSYGHFLGVNTVWVPGVLMIHMVYSIGLPILLLDLALPATRGRSLVSDRQVLVLAGILALDVVGLGLIVLVAAQFFMGWLLLIACFAIMIGLVLGARRIEAPRAQPSGSRRSERGAFALGVALFPGVILVEGLSGAMAWPASVAIGLALLVMFAVGWGTLRYVHGPDARRRWLALAFGALLPIMVAGAVTNFPLDLALIADVALVAWFLRLWRAEPVAVFEQNLRSGSAVPA